MGILISILGVFLGLRLLLFHVYCCLIACTEASAEASATLSFKPLAENLAEIKSQMEGDRKHEMYQKSDGRKLIELMLATG